MHQQLYRVAFAIARHVAIERGIDDQEPLQRDDAPRTAVQSLGAEGDGSAPLQQSQGERDEWE